MAGAFGHPEELAKERLVKRPVSQMTAERRQSVERLAIIITMTYNSDLRAINQMVKKGMEKDLEPSQNQIIEWCKLGYIKGRIAMGEDPAEYEY